MADLCAPRYLFADGLRLVEPYFYTFRTPAKGRWFGRLVLSVFVHELNIPELACRKAITASRLFLVRDPNLKELTKTVKQNDLYQTVIKNGDIVQNTVHKHEPPVSNGQDLYATLYDGHSHDSIYYSNHHDKFSSFQIIYENEEMLVVNKPSGIPVHPSGKYYYNSVTEILKHELNIGNSDHSIYTCHRLDKLTSGVVLLAKTASKAREIGEHFKFKRLRKQYLSRVAGKFPDEEVVCADPVFLLNPGHGLTQDSVNPQGEVNIEHPDIEVLIKSATTVIRKVSYDERLNQSIVRCEPLTGRTHQIRIHLRNLGFPIVNDPSYGPITTNPLKNQVELDLINGFKQRQQKQDTATNGSDLPNCLYLPAEKYQKIYEEYQNKVKYYKSDQKTCSECGAGIFDKYKDYQSGDDLMIYLHALNYTLLDDVTGEKIWSFESEKPKWASF